MYTKTFWTYVIVFTFVAAGAGCNAMQPNTSTSTPNQGRGPQILRGVTSKHYIDEANVFELWYPESATVDKQNIVGTEATIGLVEFRLPDTFMRGTNLSEAAVTIGKSSASSTLARCETALQGEEALPNTTIGGRSFKTFSRLEAAAGNRYDLKLYRTVYAGSCYELVEFIHYGNIQNYPTGTVKEFDKKQISGILNAIIATFNFTE